jgi:hypothetical protein
LQLQITGRKIEGRRRWRGGSSSSVVAVLLVLLALLALLVVLMMTHIHAHNQSINQSIFS